MKGLSWDEERVKLHILYNYLNIMMNSFDDTSCYSHVDMFVNSPKPKVGELGTKWQLFGGQNMDQIAYLEQ